MKTKAKDLQTGDDVSFLQTWKLAFSQKILLDRNHLPAVPGQSLTANQKMIHTAFLQQNIEGTTRSTTL
jgi:hypothetical protein